MATTSRPSTPSTAHEEDPAELPLERLEAELCTWSANLAAAEFRWFALLAEFDKRDGWQQWECHSCVSWMTWQLGLDDRTAREKLRVARGLVALPLVAEQMRLGRLSYSKVRAITRIAEPANEASLVAIALAGTTAQVERVVAAYRRALPPDDEASDATQWARRGVHVRQHDDRTITLTITLPAPLGMEVLAAIDHFTARPGTQPDGERPTLATRRADAVVAVAGAALAATDDQLATGRHRYLVHLHTSDNSHTGEETHTGDDTDNEEDHDTGADTRTGHDNEDVNGVDNEDDDDTERQEAYPDGTDDEMAVGVSDATAERLCCDADEETVTHSHDTGEVIDVSNRGSVIRGRLRRLVQLRDRTCRVPGCGMRARKEIHHLHHRGRGGTNELSNLLLVCSYHHHRLHEGGWRVERLDDGTVQFTLPNGVVLPAAPLRVDGDSETVIKFARDAADGRCKWEGDRLDLDWTLMTLFSHTPWHDPWQTAWRQRQTAGSAEPLQTPDA